MRILLITHFFPPKYNAGTEKYTLSLALSLQSNGHEVEVLCAADWDDGEYYWNGVTENIFQGILVHCIHLNWLKADNPNKILYDSSSIEEWTKRFLEERNFDIVHVTSLFTLGVGILRSVKKTGIPLVLTLMDFWFICPSVQLIRNNGNLCDGKTTAWECQSCLMGGSNIYRRIDKLSIPSKVQSQIFGTLASINPVNKRRGFRGMLLNMNERKRVLGEAITLPDKVISHSSIVREMVSGVLPVYIEKIRNGFSSSWLENYQQKTRINEFRFGFIGQIIHIKGIHTLIEAFNNCQFDGKARLDIWGDYTKNTEYTGFLQELIEGDHCISLKGRFEHDQLADILSEVDVLVVPSLWYENSPLVIQEAFAAQIPIIASGFGGMAEIIEHNVNGLLFERGNDSDLASQMRRMIDEPDLLVKLQKGIPRLRTITEEVNELLGIYHDLIRSKPRITPHQVHNYE